MSNQQTEPKSSSPLVLPSVVQWVTDANASRAFRVIWRWAAKPTWHDRGFFPTRGEAEAHVAKIVAEKGAAAVTGILEYALALPTGAELPKGKR